MPTLLESIRQEVASAQSLTPERQAVLDALSDWMVSQSMAARGDSISLIFICTHNSRRSHLAQIWSQAAAWYFGLHGIFAFSGGTESTAFHPNAIRALKRDGMHIEALNAGDNPLYSVRIDRDAPEMRVFSKHFAHPSNPRSNFAAVMTCSDAAEGCPVVPGASVRFALPYDDPKAADGTDMELQVYHQRSREIALEMMYVMEQVAQKLAE